MTRLTPRQAAPRQALQKARPEGLGLRGTDMQPNDLTSAASGDRVRLDAAEVARLRRSGCLSSLHRRDCPATQRAQRQKAARSRALSFAAAAGAKNDGLRGDDGQCHLNQPGTGRYPRRRDLRNNSSWPRLRYCSRRSRIILCSSPVAGAPVPSEGR